MFITHRTFPKQLFDLSIVQVLTTKTAYFFSKWNVCSTSMWRYLV